MIRGAVVQDERETLVELELDPGPRQPGPAGPVAGHPAAGRPRHAAHGAVRARGPGPGQGRPVASGAGSWTTCWSRAQPRWAGVRADYDQVLKQRNALLKSAAPVLRRGGRGRPRPSDEPVEDARASALHTLDVWDGQLARVGAQLLYARLRLLRDLGPTWARRTTRSAPASPTPRSPTAPRCASRWRPTSPRARCPEMRGAARRDAWPRLDARCASAEVERGVSLVGPHRDDAGADPGRAAGQGLRQPRRVLVVRARRCGWPRTSCCGTTSATTRC